MAELADRLWFLSTNVRRRLRRQGSARIPLDIAGVSRRDPEWTEATSSCHERYRASVALPAGDVAIVCVSMRPHLLGRLVENVARQTLAHVGVVLVANSTDFDEEVLHAADRAIRAAGHQFEVERPPEGTSLGTGLNRGLARTSARFVAKFDDDDWYGDEYLADSLRAHSYAGAGVVGKHTYYADLADLGRRVLRFPGHEFMYSRTLAGGSLVIDRNSVDDQQFEDRSIGEDRAFLRGCHRRGISTFSADRFNFVQHRGRDNTWQVPSQQFLRNTVAAPSGSATHAVVR